MIIKVLTYNIHKGFGPLNKEFTLPKIKERIQQVDADIVCLQEVMGHHTRYQKKIKEWPEQTQYEYLAQDNWPFVAYTPNKVFKIGDYGNAILSKYPISECVHHDISINRFESRGLLTTEIMVGPKQQVFCYCTHLDLLAGSRKKQIERIAYYLWLRHDCPTILAGDFNDWRKQISPLLEEELGLKEVFNSHQGTHAKTFPSRIGLLPLDRIYHRGLKVEKIKILNEKPWSKLSDHFPLFVEFKL